MDLNELRASPHLSASAISSYIDCGLSFKLGRIDKVQPEHRPEALVLGSAIHAALAKFYESLSKGSKMSARQLETSFQNSWEQNAKDREDIKYRNGKDYAALLIEGKELLSTFYSKFMPEEAAIIAIEEPFSFTIPGIEIPIIGAYDLVLEDPACVVTIVDHKTAARSYAANEVNQNMQLTIYQMAARANGFANHEILLRFDCLIKTKSPKFEQYYTVRSEKDEQRVARKIQAVWEGIKKGVFIPNDESWKCHGCLYKNACKEWFEGGAK